MKRTFILLLSLLLFSTSSIAAEAQTPNTLISTSVETINNKLYAEVTLSVAETNNSIVSPNFLRSATQQKIASKTYTIKNNFGTTLAKYTLTGTFNYNGTTSSCVKASCTTSISNTFYSCTHKFANYSGNTAFGSFTFKNSLSGKTISDAISLKCSTSGTIQ